MLSFDSGVRQVQRCRPDVVAVVSGLMDVVFLICFGVEGTISAVELLDMTTFVEEVDGRSST